VEGSTSAVKMGDDGEGSLIRPNGVAPIRMVGVPASVIFPCNKNSRRFPLAPAHPDSPKNTYTRPFYSPFSGTTRVSRCQKRTSGLYGARED